MKKSIMPVLVSSLISGLLAASITAWRYESYETNRTKRDTLRRVAAFRWCLAKGHGSQYVRDEFFGAVNEAFVVFNDSKEVLDALVKYSENISANRSLQDEDIVRLIKAMCDDVGVEYKILNDSFIKKPFAHVDDIVQNN